MSKFSKGLKRAERAISAAIPHAHSADIRAQMAASKEQLDFYQTQKQELKKEGERVSAERDVERKKLHEKQIRSLRRTQGSPSRGFMSGPKSEPSETLA